MSSFEAIKNGLDILEIASRYVELQKVNGTSYKAKTNALRTEKTSSLFFYTDSQRWHDFGSGEGGDVFDFVSKVENISLSEAKQKLSGDYTPEPIKRETPPPAPSITSDELMEEFNAFEKLTFKNYRHKSELLAVAPKWLYEQANKDDLNLFLFLARYDSKHSTLVALWAKDTIKGYEAVTYKRRRLNCGKWINRAGTHPNSVVMSRVYLDSAPVFICEGMRDFLVGVLLGLNIVSIPTASFKNFVAVREFIAPKDKVIFLVEDERAYEAMRAIAENLQDKECDCILHSLNGDLSQKMDLADFVNTKNNVEEVKKWLSKTM